MFKRSGHPNAIIIEQVLGSLNKKYKATWKKVIASLRARDYLVYKQVLNARFLKTCQVRRRVFVVAVRRDKLKDACKFPGGGSDLLTPANFAKVLDAPIVAEQAHITNVRLIFQQRM